MIGVLSQQVSHIYSGPLEDDDDTDDELPQAMVSCDPEVCVVCVCLTVMISWACICRVMCICVHCTIQNFGKLILIRQSNFSREKALCSMTKAFTKSSPSNSYAKILFLYYLSYHCLPPLLEDLYYCTRFYILVCTT